MDVQLNILSLGGGIQSSTIMLMSARGMLPKLDHIIFADTGWEPKAVYAHLDWLEETTGLPIARVSCGRNIREDAMVAQVRGRAQDGERWGAMPLFVLDNGRPGQIRRQCTSEYKIQPIEKYIRRDVFGLSSGQRMPKDARVVQWMGISSDETRRVRISKDRWRDFAYPLIGLPRDMGLGRPWSRTDCMAWLQREYPDHIVPRSACVGCPYHSNAEWRRIRDETPDEWRDAVELDEAIRNCNGMRGQAFLHADRVPLAQADLRDDAKGQRLLWEECTGYCGN